MRAHAALALPLLLTCGCFCPSRVAPANSTSPLLQVGIEFRSLQRNALETQRRLLLKLADSMPEQLYRDRAAPGQRDFAEQLFDVMSTSVLFVHQYGAIPENVPAPPNADTAAVLNTRVGMTAYINSAYAWLTWALDFQRSESREVPIELASGRRILRYQMWEALNQHAWWTMGQVVVSFRKNGMEPPDLQLF